MFKKLTAIFCALAFSLAFVLPTQAQSAAWATTPYNLYYGQTATVTASNGFQYNLTCEQNFCPAGDSMYVGVTSYVYGTYGGYFYASPAYSQTSVCSNGFVSTWYGCQSLAGYGTPYGYQAPNVIYAPVSCHFDRYGRYGHFDRYSNQWRSDDC